MCAVACCCVFRTPKRLDSSTKAVVQISLFEIETTTQSGRSPAIALFTMSPPSMDVDAEDILSESLEFLGGKPVIEEDIIHYGPLVLTVAPKVCQTDKSYILAPLKIS